MEIYQGETLGLLADATSTGWSLVLDVCYLDAGNGWPFFFSLELGGPSGVEEEEARIYREVFGVDVVPDSTGEERDLLVNELFASTAGDILAEDFECESDKVLYFTGQPDQRGAYSIEQIHAASQEYFKSIPNDLREEMEHLANILNILAKKRRDGNGRN